MTDADQNTMLPSTVTTQQRLQSKTAILLCNQLCDDNYRPSRLGEAMLAERSKTCATPISFECAPYWPQLCALAVKKILSRSEQINKNFIQALAGEWRPPNFYILSVLLFIASSASADLIDDAREILGGVGSVTRWEYNPEVVILYDEDFKLEETLSVLDDIENATGLNFVVSSRDISDDLSEEYFGRVKLSMALPVSRINDPIELIYLGEDGERYSGDIFIFLGSAEFSAYLTVLTGAAESLPELSWSFANGYGACFFQAKFDQTGMQFAYIFVSDRVSDAEVRECIYEEVAQSMGLPNDSIGTPHFTFDDEAGHKDRRYDLLLLRSLYSDEISHGDPIEDVLQEFRINTD